MNRAWTVQEVSIDHPGVQQIWEHAQVQNIYQSAAWLRAYGQYPDVRSSCFIACKANVPIAYIACLYWRKNFLSNERWSGSSGGGGGPVFVSGLSGRDERIATEKLFETVFAADRREISTSVVVFTYPGDRGDYRPVEIGVATKHTPVLNLRGRSPEEVLSQMPAKTRQYIRGAHRAGVRVEVGGRDDLEMYRSMQIAFAAERDLPASRVNSLAEMHNAWDALSRDQSAVLYKAMLGSKCIGGGIFLRTRDTLFHHSVMISDTGKRFHAPQAIQWRALSDALGGGLHSYNMVGAPGVTDALSGVTVFKQKFGAEVIPFLRYSLHREPKWVRAIKRLSRYLGRRPEPPILFYP